MQNYRFRDPLVTLRKLQQQEKIGEIQSMITSHHGGSIFARPPWLWNEEKSGGMLYENAIHAVDLQTWLMGQHRQIVGITSSYDETLNLTTSIKALVEYEHNSIGFLDFQWFASSMFFRTDIFATISDVRIKLQPDAIYISRGETGPLSDVLSDLRRVYDFGKVVLTRRFQHQSMKPHLRVVSRFVESIRKGTTPPVTIEDVLPTMRLLDEIREHIGKE